LNIKKTFWVSSQIFLLMFLWDTSAWAQQDKILKWGIGVRGGIGILTQDIFEGVSKGEPGPAISGEVFTFINNYLSVGVNIEWNTHKVKKGTLDRGEARTLSILSFYEIRVPDWGKFSPYQVLGVGLNLNSFKESSAFQTQFPGGKFDPVHTVALKIGGGLDYFITPRWALNTEIGWRFNSGEASVIEGGPVFAEDYDANVFTLILGIRKYF